MTSQDSDRAEGMWYQIQQRDVNPGTCPDLRNDVQWLLNGKKKHVEVKRYNIFLYITDTKSLSISQYQFSDIRLVFPF